MEEKNTNNSPHSFRHYYFESAGTGKRYEDVDWILDPKDEEMPSLLRSVYRERQLKLKDRETGLFRYAGWLPVHQTLGQSSATITYKSTGLARHLGLEHLYIAFSGYWPERGAHMQTCTFKETEAYPVCGRLNGLGDRTLVVASAGNTARAFARVCSDNRIPLLVFVPERNFSSLWFHKPLDDCVKLVKVRDADYLDAINLSNRICDGERFVPEGGVKNAARRDGMGTVVLSAVLEIGHIPDYYFQAIGSGSGAIAAWETNLRLLADGRFGRNKMKLIVSQNKPFTPVYHAWQGGSRQLDLDKIREEQHLIPDLYSGVLSNRKPAYSMYGGLYDALVDTAGDVLAVDNKEADEAMQLFAETEGIDAHPAAAVAVASLMQKVRADEINHDARILLNVTGGGEQRFREDHQVMQMEPHIVMDKHVGMEEIHDLVNDALSQS